MTQISKKLYLPFTTSNNSSKNIIINYPAEGLSKTAVETVMGELANMNLYPDNLASIKETPYYAVTTHQELE